MVKHYYHLAEWFADVGRPAPEHPLFAVIPVETDTSEQPGCHDTLQRLSTDFYSISLKNVVEGEVFYGKTRYDCQSGTMVFMGPNQVFGTKGVKIKSQGYMIVFHPDFLVGHPLSDRIKLSTFFDYAVDEALHLSPKEEAMMMALVKNIEQESQSGYDRFSREIVLSYMTTLLNYGERFYQRQFVQRNELRGSLKARLKAQLEEHYLGLGPVALPSLQAIADKMGMSSRYLSDAIKAETGDAAKAHIQLFIIEKAKSLLANTNEPVSNIGYDLGFEYPQYFVRLFKKKTGMTPSDFRLQFH